MTMSPDLIEAAAYRFSLLGDPTRLRLMNVLMERAELSGGEVARAAGVSRFNASAHLNRLATAGLLARRRDGTTVYYRINDVNLPRVCDWMCSSLRDRAKSFAGESSA